MSTHGHDFRHIYNASQVSLGKEKAKFEKKTSLLYCHPLNRDIPMGL